ncbi:MAG: peptide deformylase [Hamadaea sp.]|uniref:peptide deformylase n=1 Tax=Hamadaea sp. TaxID=2024425 RepID=UPI0017DE3704|nr:peptide deformylase [Hamadaea sp.]NUT19859.1 peptide deformylase [Hamadaea sp.]
MAEQPVDRRVRVLGRPVDEYPEVPPEAERGAALRVTVVGEEILHRPCRDVTEFGSPELTKLIDDMFATQLVAQGVGLAANQVDVDLRLFVYDCPDDDGVRHVGHVCNPVLDELPPAERRLVEHDEGCLSVPGPYAPVSRPDHAIVRGQDKDGNPLVLEGFGYFARCLQHETDHLNGKLYIDRLGSRQRKSVLKEMEQRKEEVFARRAEKAATLGK